MQISGSDEQITIRLSSEMKAAIRQEARDIGVSMGVIVRWALKHRYQEQAMKAGLRIEIEDGLHVAAPMPSAG